MRVLPEPAGPTRTSRTSAESGDCAGGGGLVRVESVKQIGRVMAAMGAVSVAAGGEQPPLGVEDRRGGVALGAVMPERAGAVGAAERRPAWACPAGSAARPAR